MAKDILMPALSAGMEEGTIARWLKAPGDAIERGEIIAEIETDKATLEMEATHSGVLGTILVGEGRTVAINTTIAVLHLKSEDAVANAAPASREGRVASSPLARRVAQAAGVSIEGLGGSGPGGRVVRKDVTEKSAAIEAMTPREPRNAGVRAHRQSPNTPVRKIIARRLTEAKATIPHFYLNVDCEIDDLLELRKTINDRGAGRYKVSVNDFIVKAAAMALRSVPEANVTWTEDAILLYDDVDVSVAVATDGGLITPIVRNADQKHLNQISQEIRSLAERARDNKLLPEEYQGGGFTVSNLGMYGIHSFSAIINPPQSCILAIGAGRRRPIIRGGHDCAAATMMNCTLSADHRSIDGAVGARYLAHFKELLEHPLQLAPQDKLTAAGISA